MFYKSKFLDSMGSVYSSVLNTLLPVFLLTTVVSAQTQDQDDDKSVMELAQDVTGLMTQLESIPLSDPSYDQYYTCYRLFQVCFQDDNGKDTAYVFLPRGIDTPDKQIHVFLPSTNTAHVYSPNDIDSYLFNLSNDTIKIQFEDIKRFEGGETRKSDGQFKDNDFLFGTDNIGVRFPGKNTDIDTVYFFCPDVWNNTVCDAEILLIYRGYIEHFYGHDCTEDVAKEVLNRIIKILEDYSKSKDPVY